MSRPLVYRVLTGAATLLAGLILGKVLSVAADVILARGLGPDGYGSYGTAIALLAIGLVLCSAGVDALAIREVVRTAELTRVIRHQIRYMRLKLGAIVAAPIAVMTWLGWIPAGIGVPLCIVPIAFAFREDWLLMAMRREGAVSSAGVVRDSSFLGCVLLLLAMTPTAAAAAVAFLLAEAVWSAYTVVLVSRTIRSDLKSTGESSIRMVNGLPLLTSNLLTLATGRLGTPLVTALSGVTAGGLYFACYRVISALGTLVQPLGRATLPALAAGRPEDLRAGEATARSLVALAAALGAGIGVALYFSAESVVLLLFGTAYSAAVPVLRILSVGLVFAIPSSIVLQTLIAVNRQGLVLRVTGVGAITSLVLAIALIPSMGAGGAAVGAASAEVVILAYGVWLWRRASRRSSSAALTRDNAMIAP